MKLPLKRGLNFQGWGQAADDECLSLRLEDEALFATVLQNLLKRRLRFQREGQRNQKEADRNPFGTRFGPSLVLVWS